MHSVVFLTGRVCEEGRERRDGNVDSVNETQIEGEIDAGREEGRKE